MHYIFPPFHFDTILAQFINGHHTPILDWIFLVITTLGEWAAVWGLIGLIIWMADRKKGRNIFFMILLAIIFSSFLNDLIIKTFIFRERPYLALEGIRHLGLAWHNSSFVSGHAASSVAAATILIYSYRRLTLPITLFVLLMMYSRIYLGAHYPSDIIGGIVVGLTSGLVVLSLSKIKR